MKIFLIGYMASGKSTIGRKMAEEMEFNFLDLDNEIEKSESMKISEIFSTGGEALFRGIEMKCLRKVLSLKGDYIISSGGGTPCFYDNMDRMKAAGHTLFLEMDAKSITFRLMNARGDRPMVNGIEEGELLEFVTQQMEERRLCYADAHSTVNALGMTDHKIKELCNRLMADLK